MDFYMHVMCIYRQSIEKPQKFVGGGERENVSVQDGPLRRHKYCRTHFDRCLSRWWWRPDLIPSGCDLCTIQQLLLLRGGGNVESSRGNCLFIIWYFATWLASALRLASAVRMAQMEFLGGAAWWTRCALRPSGGHGHVCLILKHNRV